MPDEDFDNDELEATEPQSERSRLRESQKRNKEQAAEIERLRSLERDLAFERAQLGDAPIVNFFKEKYEGDLTPEAIRAAATSAGVVTDTAPQDSIAAIDQMSQVGYGSPMGGGPEAYIDHPGLRVSVPASEAEMWKQFDAAIANSRNPRSSQDAFEILRRFRETNGIEGTQPAPTGAVPQVYPTNDPRWSGTPIK